MGDAVGSDDAVLVLGRGGVQHRPAQDLVADMLARMTAMQAGFDALAARVGALEVRPEEVAHFGATARLPNVAALGTFTVTLTGLVPARTGDVLRSGESVTVAAPAGLPTGVSMRAPPTVPSDGTVILSFTASVALSSATPLAWAITALR